MNTQKTNAKNITSHHTTRTGDARDTQAQNGWSKILSLLKQQVPRYLASKLFTDPERLFGQK